ncbi:hypothetical protein ACTWPF_05980 [Oceanobacillus sp. M65]|uniref:hypothetical protein n=1 Tax=Oceanobacillus sp. M65 TaxID=3457435 RepID=UPI003FCD4786
MIDAGIGKSDAMEGRREAAKEKVAQEELKVKRERHEEKPNRPKVKHQLWELKRQPPQSETTTIQIARPKRIKYGKLGKYKIIVGMSS